VNKELDWLYRFDCCWVYWWIKN